VAFPLHPETPEEGQTLEELFKGANFDIPAMMAKLESVAREEGLDFAARTMTYNSRKAQELGKWAEDQGRGEEFHLAAFKAYFARGENLAHMDVLRALAGEAGLDPHEAQEVVEEKTYAPAVDADWQKSRAYGIRAVPTFVANGRALAGAQPYEALERMVLEGGIL
jgi:predicted DsbA family dithiol-disulfide isomerase